jgi:hypothetical protein
MSLEPQFVRLIEAIVERRFGDERIGAFGRYNATNLDDARKAWTAFVRDVGLDLSTVGFPWYLLHSDAFLAQQKEVAAAIRRCIETEVLPRWTRAWGHSVGCDCIPLLPHDRTNTVAQCLGESILRCTGLLTATVGSGPSARLVLGSFVTGEWRDKAAASAEPVPVADAEINRLRSIFRAQKKAAAATLDELRVLCKRRTGEQAEAPEPASRAAKLARKSYSSDEDDDE